jgi:DNA replication protein DnaC
MTEEVRKYEINNMKIIANSVMDRMAHNSHQITMTGESYRNKGKTPLKKLHDRKDGKDGVD